MDCKIALRVLVNAINDTMGLNWLVPPYHVFGFVPRFPAVDFKLTDQQSRTDALSRARQEMATIVAEIRVRKALAFRLPWNADM